MRTIPALTTAAAALAAMLAAGPAWAQFAAIDLVWVQPVAAPDAPRPCTRMLVLTAPRDWADGDAAVLVLAPETMANAARPVVEALVAEEAAVLDYASGFGGCGETSAVAPDPVGEALGGLLALKEAGAGLVIAVGLGPSGQAALDAAREEVAARFLGPDGPRFAAAAALMGEGPAAFRMGQAPSAEDRWAERAPLLCATIAARQGAAAQAACLAALAPPAAEAQASLRPRP
jgi:hypothetical protein